VHTDKPFAIRFSAPHSGQTEVHDLIKGKVVFNNVELDDLIICRRDGTPTYNFVVVVDDVTMKISHLIRGDDHLNNTPRQILLYQALNYPLPQFAHMSLTLALINFIVRLGWSYGDEEIFSMDELIEKFSLENVGKAAGVFNPDKLDWLNSHYIKQETNQKLAEQLLPFLKKRNIRVDDKDYLVRVIGGFKERAKTLDEMAEKASFYFYDTIDYEPKAAKKFLTAEMAPVFLDVIAGLEKAGDVDEKAVQTIFNQIADKYSLSLGQLAQPHRVALTGGTASPGIYEVIANLGKERVLKRLRDAVAFIKA
jgi:glutamyl-tRNA synthetase